MIIIIKMITIITNKKQGGVLLWGVMILSPHGALFNSLSDSSQDVSSFLENFPSSGATIAFMMVESFLFIAYSYYTDSLVVAKVEPTTDPLFDPRVLENLDADVIAERERTELIFEQSIKNGELRNNNVDVEKIYNKNDNNNNNNIKNNNAEEAVDSLEKGTALSSKKQTKSLQPLKINHLRKVFPPTASGRKPVVATQDLSMTVQSGEIFGLLGANGAGKTTTLSMLTRLMLPTSGDAFIANYSILNDFKRAAKQLGVVTQNNSLWDLLSVEDHLYLFARIRGVPEDLVTKVVDGTIDQLELTPHRKKLSVRLSGGMKRKLCVAIALIGDPEVVLLDEPSAGLDPVSRRNLWSVILRTMSQRSVILTTHSMEEAEALCKRIGIMVNGQMRALGTKQHLKNKFGSGFELTVKLIFGTDENPLELTQHLNDFVLKYFPSARLISDNGGLVTYEIPKEEMHFGLVFTQFENNKHILSIENYSVAQPTLEQVNFYLFNFIFIIFFFTVLIFFIFCF
jgi:ABC-type multidrug transport system ATPase subunit